MHELVIATSVLDAVRTEAARHPGAHPVEVGVRVGDWSGVDPEALRFSFELLVQGTELEPLHLEIERCAPRHECRRCGSQFVTDDGARPCPDCGAEATRCVAGDELELTYLEVEEP